MSAVADTVFLAVGATRAEVVAAVAARARARRAMVCCACDGARVTESCNATRRAANAIARGVASVVGGEGGGLRAQSARATCTGRGGARWGVFCKETAFVVTGQPSTSTRQTLLNELK